MISTGIVRRVGDTGKFTIPLTLLKELKIDYNHARHVEFFVGDDCIALIFFESGCTFCHSIDDIKYWRDKRVCRKCLEELKKIEK